jgi:hypothetical protein
MLRNKSKKNANMCDDFLHKKLKLLFCEFGKKAVFCNLMFTKTKDVVVFHWKTETVHSQNQSVLKIDFT